MEKRDKFYGMELSAEETERLFVGAVRAEKEKSRRSGKTTCEYDREKGRAYLLHPDGSREYHINPNIRVAICKSIAKSRGQAAAKRPNAAVVGRAVKGKAASKVKRLQAKPRNGRSSAMGDFTAKVVVFAGPNGSGKSTITNALAPVGEYINADDIKKSYGCSDLEAAQLAEKLREGCLAKHADFTFETVLSTTRNLELLKRAKKEGYFVLCYYVLTSSPDINVMRVRNRVNNGGHNVPEVKVTERYHKALALIPELIPVCDVCYIYDNTDEPSVIFGKRFNTYSLYENDFWSRERIISLTHCENFDEQRLKSTAENH